MDFIELGQPCRNDCFGYMIMLYFVSPIYFVELRLDMNDFEIAVQCRCL